MDALKGSAVAVISAYLVALVFAYTFRLPIPLGGMLGPLGELSPYGISLSQVLVMVFGAWVFYGLFGGFLILPVLGAVAGWNAGRKYHASAKKNQKIALHAAIASVFPVAGLSILDYVIGPW